MLIISKPIVCHHIYETLLFPSQSTTNTIGWIIGVIILLKKLIDLIHLILLPKFDLLSQVSQLHSCKRLNWWNCSAIVTEIIVHSVLPPHIALKTFPAKAHASPCSRSCD